MLQNTCVSWKRHLAGASATEFQGSCSSADFLQPLSFKPLWSLYRAISIHPRETCHPKVPGFREVIFVIVVSVFWGFFWLLFFPTVTPICLDSYYRNSIHTVSPGLCLLLQNKKTQIKQDFSPDISRKNLSSIVISPIKAW